MKIKIKPLAPLYLSAAICLLLFAAQPASAVPPATTTALAVTSGAVPVTTVASGTVVTLTATVTANSAPVTIGQVNFCDASATYCTDIHLLGTAQLTTAGTAIFKFIPAGGSHTYKAVFTGTSSDLTSASTAASLIVNAIPTTTTIAQSGSTGNYALTATVTGTGSLTVPTGTVSFLDTSNGNASLGTAPLTATPKAALTWINSQSPATKPQPGSILVSDFNGDGIPDLAFGTTGTTGTGGTGYLSIMLGNGDGTFKPASNFAALAKNPLIVAAPFVTGGPMDILSISISASNTNNAVVLIGDGTGSGTVGTPFSLQVQSASAVATGDFNGDGKQDFVVTGTIPGGSSYAIAIYFGKGDGTFGSPTIIPLSAAPQAIAVGNFHGGGSALDIAVATMSVTSSPGAVAVFLNDSIGDFSQGVGGTTGVGPDAMVVGDFNRDGKLDLAVTNATSNTVTILLGNGDSSGTFTAAAVSPATGNGPTSIATGDFNGDGIVDLAVAVSGPGTSNGTITILLGNGDGTFTAGATQATGIDPVGIAAGNLNADATADLAVTNLNPTNTTSSTLTILLSQQTLTATATAANISPAGTGTHLVDASYLGDTIYAPSVSSTISLGAQTTATTLALTATPASSTFGQQVVLSATSTPFSASGNTTNGEAITFFNGATSLGTGTLASGVATLNITSLPLGTDSLTAKYPGDTNFATSTSAAITETVTAPLPAVSLTPASLTFASQALTTQSAAQNLTLMNTGLGTLNITSITASTGFVETSTCAATLAAATPCNIAVKFAPTANGTQTGTVTVVDNAAGSPHIVTLTGAGPTVTVGATSSSLNVTAPGSPATTTINITPVAGFTGTVNLTCTVAYTGSGANHDLPACSLNPTPVPVTSGAAVTSTLTVTTTASASATPNLLWPRSVTALATLFLIGLLPRRRWKNPLLLAILSIATLCTLSGCGGGSSTPPSTSDPGTTTGSYQVTVTATSTGFTATTIVPLTLQ